MSPRSIRLIGNPRAGGHARRTMLMAAARLRAAGLDVDEASPASVDEMRALGSDPGRYDATVLSGGDGTIAAYLQDAPLERTVLGVIPRGTGNVVARDLELPFEAAVAVEVILRGRSREIDVGEARWPDGSRRRFVLSLSTGSFAAAVADVSPALKAVAGRAAYAASLVSSRSTRHSVRVRTTAGDHVSPLAIALLTKHYAGGFVPVRDSVVGDGKFDLLALDDSVASVAALSNPLLRRLPGMTGLIHHERVDAVEILTPGPVELDGDPAPDSPVTLKIAGKVRILSAR